MGQAWWWLARAILILLTVVGLGVATPALADGNDVASLRATLRTITSRVEQAQRHVAAGDLAAARADGAAIEESWSSVEAGVASRAPSAESQVDRALDAANAALNAEPPAADVAERLAALDQALDALDQALVSAPSAPGAAPSDQVALGQELRWLQDARSALAAGDVAGARQALAEFQENWPASETSVAAQSDAAYHLVENQLPLAEAALAANPPRLADARAAVDVMATALQPLVGAETHYGPFDAAVTLLREGLEAILVISALLALISRAGRADLRHRVWLGAGAGVLASVLVAAGLQIVFSQVSAGLNRELLEGTTGLIAAAMLLYVSYWLHDQGNLTDWRKFLASRTGRALTSGSTLTLPFLAFLAVFREGAETLLLYLGMAASISLSGLLLGMGLGLAGLALLGLAILRFGLRLSLRPFFQGMSLLLYYLAFKFVGTGIHALQVAGVLPATSAPYLPSFEFFGLFPTWQTTLAQVALLVLAASVVVWLALPRRPAGPSQAAPAAQ